MQKLSQNCLGIQKLEIKYSDLSSINVNDLPLTIEELSLIRCEIPVDWFRNNKLKQLSHLNLSDSARICSTHIKDLEETCHLNCLILKNCYRVNDKLIEILIENECFKKLAKLNLEATTITQYGLQLIYSKFLNQLDYLNLRNCKNIRQVDLQLVKSYFEDNKAKKLEI